MGCTTGTERSDQFRAKDQFWYDPLDVPERFHEDIESKVRSCI